MTDIIDVPSRAAGAGQRVPQPKANCTNCRKSGMRKAQDNTLQLVCRAELPKVYSAVVVSQNGPQLMQSTIWPVVEDTDWCMAHEPALNS